MGEWGVGCAIRTCDLSAHELQALVHMVYHSHRCRKAVLGVSIRLCVCVWRGGCARMCVCVCVCVCARARARVKASVRARVFVFQCVLGSLCSG